MIRTLAAVALAAFATAAAAEGVRLDQPLAGATIDAAGTPMSIYWTEEGDAANVVAVYLDGADNRPTRIIMDLKVGDAVSFALPGVPQTRYEFARTEAGVTVDAVRAWTEVASN